MLVISNWAGKHVLAARLLLCVLHTCLVVSAMQLCPLLTACGITLSFRGTLFVCMGGFVLVLATRYLKKNFQNPITLFRLQKLRFLVTGICCLLLVIGFYSGGSFLKYHLYNNLSGAFTRTAKMERPSYESYDNKKLFYEDLKTYYKSLSKKELRKELRHELKNLAKKRDTGENIVLVILVILGMLLSLYLIAGLACTLSCNGSEALAIIVGVGGTLGVLWLTVYLLTKILKKQKQPVQEKPVTIK